VVNFDERTCSLLQFFASIEVHDAVQEWRQIDKELYEIECKQELKKTKAECEEAKQT
jgi:hypothetical protein